MALEIANNPTALYEALSYLRADQYPVDVTVHCGRDPAMGRVLLQLHDIHGDSVAVQDILFGNGQTPDTRTLTVLPADEYSREEDWSVQHQQREWDVWRPIEGAGRLPKTPVERRTHFDNTLSMAVTGLNRYLSASELTAA